jgi:hypothetical protein
VLLWDFANYQDRRVGEILPLVSRDVRNMVGLTAHQLVERLPELLPSVAQYRFVRYIPSPGFDQRSRSFVDPRSEAELARLEAASPRVFEQISGLLAVLVVGEHSARKAIDEMLRHDDSREKLAESSVDANEVSAGGISKLINALSAHEALGISSACVLTDGSSAHLPLLDFSLPASVNNCSLVVESVKRLGLLNAFVLESGRSYHVYGLRTLSEREWLGFMGRALLLAPMIDVRFIAHRLIAGHAVLRVNPTTAKPREPHIVAAF